MSGSSCKEFLESESQMWTCFYELNYNKIIVLTEGYIVEVGFTR